MIEYFEPREDGSLGKFHFLVKLTDEFVKDVKNDKTGEMQKAMVQIFENELEDWIKSET